jgi:hypothetical protein
MEVERSDMQISMFVLLLQWFNLLRRRPGLIWPRLSNITSIWQPGSLADGEPNPKQIFFRATKIENQVT